MSNKCKEFLRINPIDVYNSFNERICNLAQSNFSYDGLPETINTDDMERTLLINGSVAIGRVTGTDIWLALPWIIKQDATGGTPLDVYGWPKDIRLVPKNGIGPLDVDEFIIIYDNKTKKSLIPEIRHWAKQLTKDMMTFNMQLNTQNRPVVALTSKDKILALKNFEAQRDNYESFIEVSKNFDIDNIHTIDFRCQYMGSEIMNNLESHWQMAMNMIGIVPMTTKRERMNTAELVMNGMEAFTSINSRARNRVDALNKFNKLTGASSSVNLSSTAIQDALFPEMGQPQLFDEEDNHVDTTMEEHNEKEE